MSAAIHSAYLQPGVLVIKKVHVTGLCTFSLYTLVASQGPHTAETAAAATTGAPRSASSSDPEAGPACSLLPLTSPSRTGKTAGAAPPPPPTASPTPSAPEPAPPSALPPPTPRWPNTSARLTS